MSLPWPNWTTAEWEEAIRNRPPVDDRVLARVNLGDTWSEDDHPRDDAGKFTEGQGTAVGDKKAEPKKDQPSWLERIKRGVKKVKDEWDKGIDEKFKREEEAAKQREKGVKPIFPVGPRSRIGRSGGFGRKKGWSNPAVQDIVRGLHDGLSPDQTLRPPVDVVVAAMREGIGALHTIINLPVIEDVRGPGAPIGAIPAKPKPKKRKKVAYRDVVLGRMPTEFEAYVLSLNDIPQRFDREIARTVETLKDIRLRSVKDLLVANTPESKTAVRAVVYHATLGALHASQLALGRYGAFELRNECRRQHLRLSDEPEESLTLASEFVRTSEFLRESATQAAESLSSSWMATLDAAALRLRRSHRSVVQLTAMAEAQAEVGLKMAVRRSLQPAFTLTRRDYMGRLVSATERDAAISLARRVDEDKAEELVDYVIQTAVMDANTCGPCEAVDGLTFEYDSDEMLEHQPPYYLCDGGDNCRCTQVYVLLDGESWVVREDRIR